MNNPFIEILKTELKNPLPGKQIQYEMAPEHRNKYNLVPGKNTKKSGILILLFPKDNFFNTVLFQRPEYNGLHAGQVCFPGGKVENMDISLEDTAIREAWEEIGVEKDKIEILGKLTPLYIPVSDYLVNPFVGYTNFFPNFKPDPSEVEQLIVCSLNDLLDSTNIKSKIVKFKNKKVIIPFYSIKNFEIWGATAMIISEFTNILKRPSFQRIS